MPEQKGGEWLRGLALTILLGPLSAGAVCAADVVKETVLFLQEDGRHYLAYTTARTDWPRYDLYLNKQEALEQFLYVYPNHYDWDGSSDTLANILRFNQSDYATITPGELGERLSMSADGQYHFRSWDGVTREDGHYGYWTNPGEFTQFVYVWVLPRNFEFVSYQSNRKGEWVQRHNTLAYYGSKVNDLVFDIVYRPHSYATYDALKNSLSEARERGEVQIEQQQSGVRVTLRERLLFPSGSSALSPAGKQLLARIARGLQLRPKVRVIVSGHTDDVPINSRLKDRYESNWELSSARALAVVHELDGEGIGGDRLEARAYGPYRPRFRNDTAEGRAQNRRIELEIVEGE